MELHDDEEDAVRMGLHRSFVQDTAVLASGVTAIVAAKGDADPAIFKKAQGIVEKYQEQGQLLEPLLEGIITPVMGLVRSIVIDSNGSKLEKSQLQVVKKLCSLIHTLMTVCSYKTVVKFFPHQAADLELAVGLLEQCEEEVTVGSILKEESTGEWETKCCLLLWLSILVLIPFDLASVDTSLADSKAADAGLTGHDEPPPLVQRMIKICTAHLESPGPTREMAGVLLSRLLTRPDMRGALRRFMAWTHDSLSAPVDGMVGVFLVPGVIMAIAAIFKVEILKMVGNGCKVGGRDILLDVAPSAWEEASKLARSQEAIRSPLLRKLLVKLIQRIGNTYLPPRVASWRYMRGSRSLIQNLTAVSENIHIDIVHSKDDNIVASGGLGSSAVDTEVSEEDIEIPEIMEEVIEFLLAGLRDKDTVVRWSAAKGVGRVTGRLSLSFADDVVASVLDLFQPTEAEVQKAVKAEKRMAGSLVRLHFHDCFVNGCDGSLLLDNSTEFISEKFARGNVNSVRGFEVIDNIKKILEKACPRTVSCADILAIAYRDSVVAVGLVPEYPVSLGRRDSVTSDINLANANLPGPGFNFTQLIDNFANVGLDETDLIALSGSHTIGRVSCANIRRSGVIDDVGSNAEFRKRLETLCPENGTNALQDLDYKTPDKFDNNYYKNLMRGEGAIRSDQTLQSTPGPNQAMVKDFAKNQEKFFAQFAKSSIKMGDIPLPPNMRSEVRRNCRVVNPQSLIEYE